MSGLPNVLITNSSPPLTETEQGSYYVLYNP